MLVLSRKVGQQIQVGPDVTIEVRKVCGNRVSLGIRAPGDVRILRGELKEMPDGTTELVEVKERKVPRLKHRARSAT